MKREAGQSLVESALVLTAFLALLVGMASVGQTLFVRQALADRARIAARWGALHSYDPAAIRRIVLSGTGDLPSFGLTPEEIEVSDPGCPGLACRVAVAIPAQGIRCVEPAPDFTPRSSASQP